MDLIDHLVPTPLPWAGTPSSRRGCSKPHSTWPQSLSAFLFQAVTWHREIAVWEWGTTGKIGYLSLWKGILNLK